MKTAITVVMVGTVLATLSAATVLAQPAVTCIEAGNGVQVCDPYTDHWERNGVEILGEPISHAFDEPRYESDMTLNVQYFSRQRLELHGDAAGGTMILLGRLGDEVLRAQGQNWHAFPKDDSSASDYVDVTGFAIAPEFAGYWSGNGLDLGDDGVSFRESLMLFGYPISQARMETNPDGQSVLTQWFERARFELHDGQVRLADLGSELLDVPGAHDPMVAAQLAQVRQSVATFADISAAQSAGWGLVDGLDHCFNNPDVGAMGVHYINVDLLDTELDPLSPEAMVYQHGSDGELSFGAVEWIVPADAWDAENPNSLPSVLGRDLHLNEALGVYVMHAWIFLENPSGVFEDWNSEVSCPSEDE